MTHPTITFKLLAPLVLLAAAALPASAQTIYRIVGADGKVTFSDKPPVDTAKATAMNSSGRAVGTAESNALPFELRQIVARYPVTLYSAAGCVPCNSGRLLLQGRGVPFTENTVSSADDTEALRRISGDNSLPFLTIGGQKIKGFSETEWSQFLSAANYPQTSALPGSYRNPPAKPLVAVQKPAEPKQDEDSAGRPDEKSAENRPPQTPAAPPPSPTGIRF